MAIDFTLTPEQKVIRLGACDFAQTVLAPIVGAVDEEPDPLRAFQMMKPAYVEASKRGMAWTVLPKEYGGGGLSNVDYIIAAEEIQSVDPGFGTTLLVNGLGLLPIWYYGSEDQKRRFIGGATADTSGEFIAGYAASEPPGSPGGTANFDAPAGGGAAASTGRATSRAGMATARISTWWSSAPIPRPAAGRACPQSWSNGERPASRTT